MNTRSKLIALQTISAREIRRFMRIWVQTILPPVITTALYFVIFGNLIGPRIGQMNGFDYMEFIIPGLIMMAVITNSYANVVSSFYGSKFQRHIEEMLISPVPNYIILLGYVSGGVARGLIVGVAVMAVSLVFNPLNIHSIPVMLSMILLTSILFSLAGLINGVYANSFDDISIIPTFVLTPLTYLGGIFYSISMLPDFWQNMSLANPILYMVNAFRYGFLGISDISLWTSYVISLGFIITLYVFSLHLLRIGYGIRS
jgi:ABC-2 type transport system permease protein